MGGGHIYLAVGSDAKSVLVLARVRLYASGPRGKFILLRCAKLCCSREQIYFDPEKIYFGTEQIYIGPEQIYFGPEQIYFDPESKYILFQSKQVYFAPEQIYFGLRSLGFNQDPDLY